MIDLIAADSIEQTALCCPSTAHIFSASITVCSAISATPESFFLGLFQGLVNHQLHFENRTKRLLPYFPG